VTKINMSGRLPTVISRYIESTGTAPATDTVIDLDGGCRREPTLPMPLYFVRKRAKPAQVADTHQALMVAEVAHLQKRGRTARALLLAAVIAVAVIAAVRPALGATDRPGKPGWVCRWKLVAIDPPHSVYVCKRVVK